MTAKPKQEKSFDEQAKDYADISIANIREMIAAMEHAAECGGEMDCPECEGVGQMTYKTAQGEDEEEDCRTCEGAGKVPCAEGKDSDDPESWHDEDRARTRIQEDALSVEVRSDWYTPGDTDAAKPSEFNILITTGGPAARIIGDLDEYGQPTRARFEYQDWGKPWTEVVRDHEDYQAMLTYAQQFYFGE